MLGGGSSRDRLPLSWYVSSPHDSLLHLHWSSTKAPRPQLSLSDRLIPLRLAQLSESLHGLMPRFSFVEVDPDLSVDSLRAQHLYGSGDIHREKPLRLRRCFPFPRRPVVDLSRSLRDSGLATAPLCGRRGAS